jgi:hypothetical protein
MSFAETTRLWCLIAAAVCGVPAVFVLVALLMIGRSDDDEKRDADPLGRAVSVRCCDRPRARTAGAVMIDAPLTLMFMTFGLGFLFGLGFAAAMWLVSKIIGGHLP